MVRQAHIFHRISLGRLLYMALLFFGAAAVVLHLAQTGQVWQTVRSGVWWWIGVAAFFQFLFLLNQSAIYSAIYQMIKLPERFSRLFLLVLAAAFTAVVIPGGSLSGAGLMVYDSTRRGMEAARVVLANVIFFLLDYLAFLLVLIIALVYLFACGALRKYQVAAAGILVALVAAAHFLLIFSAARPTALADCIRRAVGSFALLLPAAAGSRISAWGEKAVEFVTGIARATKTLRENKAGFTRSILHVLLVEVIGLLQLQALFLAFGSSPRLGQLITGYAVGVLFMIVSITPSGVGIMEGAMTAAYTSVGIPLEQAALVTFIYRALSFWLPTVCGFLALRWLVKEE